MAKRTPLGLGKREQQIVDAVHQIGEASVADVIARIEGPPSYSAVRTMLGILVDKGALKLRRDGKRYLYRPITNPAAARKGAVRKLLSTFFGDSPVEAFATLLDVSSQNLSPEEVAQLRKMIDGQTAAQKREGQQ